MLSEFWSMLSALLVAIGLAPAPAPPGYQGYVEGEFVLVAPEVGGRLAALSVSRGDQVAKGAALFAIEDTEPAAQRDRAQAALDEAGRRLADLMKGERQSKLDAMRARIQQAEAQLRFARARLTRQQQLAESTAFSRENLDQATAEHDAQRARVNELKAELADAEAALGRDDQIAAARAVVAQARAALAEAEWRLAQTAPAAPAAGLVAETFFRPGETVAAGQPVVSILPPENRKVRFFVPEAMLAALPVGTPVAVLCDGCGQGVEATVRFVAPAAEYTPPVLYNRDQRNRLVYLMEARPTDPAQALRLRPGQPVDVVTKAP